MSWILSLLFLVCLTQSVSSQCTPITDPLDASKNYDLSPLANAAVDYQCTNTRYPSYNFYINVCQSIVAIDSVCGAGTGICEKSSFSSSKIGMSSTTFTIASEGNLEMIFPTGSGCFSGKITFICTPGSGIGNPVYVQEDCEYQFTWATEYACSGGSTGGLSIGSILCIIFFVSLFLYLAIGMGIKYKKYEARGVDMVPNIDFWREVPGLVKDGFSFVKSKVSKS